MVVNPTKHYESKLTADHCRSRECACQKEVRRSSSLFTISNRFTSLYFTGISLYRHEFKLAKENAEKWTHRATTHENSLKKKNEEIVSLQEEVSDLQNRLAEAIEERITEAEHYKSALEIKEALTNQLQESNEQLRQANTKSTTKLALATNKYNILKRKFEHASSVNGSLVEKLKDQLQENNDLKRKLDAVSSERDSLAKKLKCSLESPQTLDTISDSCSDYGNDTPQREMAYFKRTWHCIE